MRRAHPVEVVRAAERPLIEAAERAGDPDAVMRRAAAGVAHHTAAFLREREGGVYGRSVLLLVGAGDNGGDALYAGAVLRERGCRVDAILLDSDRVHGRGLEAYRRAGGRIRTDDWVATAGPKATTGSTTTARRWPDVVVDGVVGLGGSGPLRAPVAGVVAELTRAGVPFVAVDLPSGVDADTGIVHTEHVRASVTVTFGLLRRAHMLASPVCGRVEVVDIGLDDSAAASGANAPPDIGATQGTVASPDRVEIGRAWPVPGPADDKYSQGVVAVRAGSERYPGAAVLCAAAAVAATSGMVRYVGSATSAVIAKRPEIVCHPTVAQAGTAQSWVVGPGTGTDAESVAEVTAVLTMGRPTVLDADALTCIAEHPVVLRSARAPVLLTPHGGEFDRLTGGWDRSDRAGALRRYVAGLRESGVEATVLLKGRVTLIDDGETTHAVDSGASWAATAGSGDVLSGIVGALLAHGMGQGGVPAWPAIAAAVVHAEAARQSAHRAGKAGVPIGASDLLAAIPAAIASLRTTPQDG